MTRPNGNRTHGEAPRRGRKTTEYVSWSGMIQRCHNPSNPAYDNYGGRGIAVCEQWRSDYSSFLAHVGRRPSKRHTIDRIDCNRGYEPGNVRWATWEVQGQNKRTNRLVHALGQTMSITAWARQTGIHRACIAARLDRYGWAANDAVSAPVQFRHENNHKHEVENQR